MSTSTSRAPAGLPHGARRVLRPGPVRYDGLRTQTTMAAVPSGTGHRRGAQGRSYSPRNLRWLVGLSPIAASSPTVWPWLRLMPT
jgi:hypothetical protein